MKIEDAIKQSSFRNEFQKLLINILYTGSWLSLKNAEMLRPYNLTIQQYNVLRILRGQFPKPATINLIIDRMLDKTSNASRIVDKLIEKELVTRSLSEDDRRCVDVLITDTGLALLKEIEHDEMKFLKTFSNLTADEAKELNNLLDKLRK